MEEIQSLTEVFNASQSPTLDFASKQEYHLWESGMDSPGPDVVLEIVWHI